MSRRERRPQNEARESRPPAGFVATPPAPGALLRLARLQRETMSLYEAGQPRRALKVWREVLAQLPDRPEVLAFAGTLAFRAGGMEEAAEFYRRALDLGPNVAESHFNLANALAALGRLDEAAALYRRTAMLRPNYAPAHHNLGNVLRSLGRPLEALEAYRRALSLQRTAAGERDLGIALHDLGRLDEAIAAYRRSLALPGHPVNLYSNLANALLERGEAQGAAEACERFLELVPGCIEAMALKALALNELGDTAGARRLLDFDRFVRIVDFAAPPPGYPSIAAFNRALVAQIETDPGFKVPPADHPTYHNDALEITGPLAPKGAVAAFESVMKNEVARYFAAVPREPPHPFPENLPKKWGLATWATRLRGQGNLDPHIHFTGYLGGVYYPLLPDIVGEPGRGEAGWFELGRPPDKFHCKAEPLVRRLQPKEGRLLLFPGYFFHATIPFVSTQTRISVAFDAMARE